MIKVWALHGIIQKNVWIVQIASTNKGESSTELSTNDSINYR